jgi:hypothetical protein
MFRQVPTMFRQGSELSELIGTLSEQFHRRGGGRFKPLKWEV